MEIEKVTEPCTDQVGLTTMHQMHQLTGSASSSISSFRMDSNHVENIYHQLSNRVSGFSPVFSLFPSSCGLAEVSAAFAPYQLRP